MSQGDGRKKSDMGHAATTRMLTRVLVCLKENPGMSLSQIRCMARKKKVCIEDALLWLCNHGLVKCVKEKASTKHYYFIYGK